MDLKAFDDYVGQRRIVSQLLPDLTACLKQHKTPPHMVLYGRPGLGKDHLVVRIGQFLGARVHMYYGPEIARDKRWSWNNAFKDFVSSDAKDEWPGLDMAGFIKEPAHVEKQILVINEADAVSTAQWESLHPVLMPGPDGRRLYMECVNRKMGSYVHCWAAPFTLILLTNFITKLRQNAMAVVDRCAKVMQLQPYSDEELASIIVTFSKKNHVEIDPAAAIDLSKRAKASPRRAEQLWQSCDNERVLKDAARITAQHVQAAMDREGVADDGLNDEDLNYLAALSNSPGGVGQERLACVLGMPVEVLSSEIEPWLFQQNLITVVAGTGRVLTHDGLRRVGRSGRSNLRFA